MAGATVNDLKDAIELGWYILTGLVSAVFTIMIQSFRLGGRLEKMATKVELDDYVRRQEFVDYKESTSKNFDRIEKQLSEARAEIIDVIRETRE